jgi:Protein of unknown function (DUF3309)
MYLLVVIILLVLVIGGLPQFGWHPYRYGPSSVVGVVLVILVILLLLGRL